ncbi:MAG: hypothetical protein WEE89_07155 [Gemmatimonadota bacterium]
MRSGALLVALCAGVTGCGDPLVVLGDLPNQMRIIAGVADQPGTRVDSSGAASELQSPTGLAVRDNGDLIAVDHARRVLSVSQSGRLTVLYHGQDCFDRSCVKQPQGIAVQGEALLIADNGSDRIWRFDLQTRALTSVAGTGVNGSSADGSVAIQSPVANPGDVVVLPDGRIVFSERAGHMLRTINPDGRLGTLAGTGLAGYSGDNGPATAARLDSPTGLAIAGGSLYVADYGNSVIRLIDLGSGTIRTVAGIGTAGYSGDNGPALEAKLDRPWAVELSPDAATLFFTEVGSNRVRSVNLNVGIISTFAGTGDTDFNGNGRAAGETALYSPFGITASPQGFLYIADTLHHLIWRTPVRF